MILLPLLTFVAVAWLCLPRAAKCDGGLRLALLRAGVIVAGVACLSVELLSALGALNRFVVTAGWAVALLITAALSVGKVAVLRRALRTGKIDADAGTASRPGSDSELPVTAPDGTHDTDSETDADPKGADPEAADQHGADRHGADHKGANRKGAVGVWAVVRDRLALPRLRPRSRGEWVAAGVLGLLFLLELTVALLAPPNNFDSQTYHLPKIEHWIQQGNVDFYPTLIDRQLAMAPGAEYLLLHLRLLTGGDGAYNLVQFAAGVGAVLVTARIAGQLGGDRRAQLVTALIVASTPMVLLEATSTQTDLTVAFWVGCVATLALDGLRRRATWPEVLLLGGAAGLTLLTKATGMLAAGLLLVLWAVAQLRHSPRRGVAGAVLIGVLMAAFAGPYLLRVQQTYDNPLGPEHLRDSISMQKHDPASVLVNALRIGETALQTPIQPANAAVAGGIIRFSKLIGVDPQSRDITYWNEPFPHEAWPPDEDRVSLPMQGLLVLLGALLLLVRRGTTRPVRLYAAVFWLAVLAYVVTVKWQPWGNRLILFLLIVGAPLAGLWIAGLWIAGLPRLPGVSRRRVVTWTATAALAVGVLAGGFSIAYGWPRRLVGKGSVFTTSTLDQRFNRRPEWRADYVWGADALRAAGVRRVGLIEGYNTWEYPWWVLLPDTHIESALSLQPSFRPAPIASFDAILCVQPLHDCGFYLPPTWKVRKQGEVSYALNPH